MNSGSRRTSVAGVCIIFYLPLHAYTRADYRALPPVDLLSSVASGATDAYPSTDLDILDRALNSVTEMLDRVLAYVRSVLSGEVKGDPAVGRYLMDTFGASTEELEKGAFNTSLQASSRAFLRCRHITDLHRNTGHTHGFLSCESGPLTSGGLSPPGIDPSIVDVQK